MLTPLVDEGAQLWSCLWQRWHCEAGVGDVPPMRQLALYWHGDTLLVQYIRLVNCKMISGPSSVDMIKICGI
jgi:hypothetical protein